MKNLKNRKTAEWLTSLSNDDITVLDLEIYAKYGIRRVNNIGDMLEDDINLVSDIIWLKYAIKWDRLYTSYVSEYNPIWNVDGSITETETRDLEYNHTGTDRFTSSGTDSTTHTGTDTNALTGTVTEEKTGTDTNRKTGTEVLDSDISLDNTETYNLIELHTGTDANAHTGSDTETNTGTVNTGNTGTQTNAEKIFGFDSTTGADSTSSTRTDNLTELKTNNLTDTTQYNSTTTETRNLNDSKTGTIRNIADNETDNTTTYNTTDTETLDITNETTHATTNLETKNLTDSTQYGKTDLETKSLQDTDEGTVTRETIRQGNIGVTMTQQLLQADLDYWNNVKALFYDTVISDVVNEITYKIYC